METLRPGALVMFVGPPAPVVDWPSSDEQGTVLAVTEEQTAHVMWERSTTIVAWPPEWLRLIGQGSEEVGAHN